MFVRRLGQSGQEPCSGGYSCPQILEMEDGDFAAVGADITQEAKKAMREFDTAFLALKLPSCPSHLIDVTEDPFRPQPRLDRDKEDGMVTSVGRVRKDLALTNGIKYVLVSHNTKMGAAKGGMLVAEYLIHKGHI